MFEPVVDNRTFITSFDVVDDGSRGRIASGPKGFGPSRGSCAREVSVSRGVAGFSGSAARRGRLAVNLTADELAIQIGVTEQTVLRWERGEASPTADHLGALAEALDLAAADLLPRRMTQDPTLRDLRHFCGLSIRAVADRTSLSASGIVRLERGVSSLAENSASKLARVYGVALDEVDQAYRATQGLRLGGAVGKKRLSR
jgi:transcriptional regulator with XRE-family HTH domain